MKCFLLAATLIIALTSCSSLPDNAALECAKTDNSMCVPAIALDSLQLLDLIKLIGLLAH